MLLTKPRALYAAFDRFPSRKGAAVHIDRFARALFESAGGGWLHVLGDPTFPLHQVEEGVEITRFVSSESNFLKRTLAWGADLDRRLDLAAGSLELCHFRDPWSGIPIVSRPHEYATLFEVNALPSIELPYRFPSVAPATLQKIRELELICLRQSDAIVTPSETTREFLISLDIPEEKIEVVRNGAELPSLVERPVEAPERYILYFGAMQPWQGIETLFRAFARLADFEDLRLVLVAPRQSRETRKYAALAERLDISPRLIWMYSLTESELAPWRQHAIASIAPLSECSRNIEQGCAPLKIVESMGSGTAVIASNLPVVRELMSDGVEGKLVAPDRPAELARAIRILLDYPELAREMGARGRQRVARDLTWERSLDQLKELYHRLGIGDGNLRERNGQLTWA